MELRRDEDGGVVLPEARIGRGKNFFREPSMGGAGCGGNAIPTIKLVSQPAEILTSTVLDSEGCEPQIAGDLPPCIGTEAAVAEDSIAINVA